MSVSERQAKREELAQLEFQRLKEQGLLENCSEKRVMQMAREFSRV